MRRRRTIENSIFFSILCCVTICGGQTRYTATDLGKLTDANSSSASGVNNSGRIVGVQWSGTPLAVFWPKPGTDVESVVPAIFNPVSSWANAINESGQVVGYFIDGNHYSWGYLYDSNTGMFQTIDVPQPAVAPVISVGGINQKGTAVGFVGGGWANQTVFTYDGTSALMHPGPYPFTSTWAFSINNSGDIAGGVYHPSINDYLPAIFDAATSNWIMISLPSHAVGGEITGINDEGIAVGAWWDASHLYYPLIARKDGSIIDVPAPPAGSMPVLRSVNNSGLAVGADWQIRGHAVAYDIPSRKWIDLTAQIVNAGVIRPDDARSVSSDGKIVGVGFPDGVWSESHAFLLTPVLPYKAIVQAPISADGSSIFSAQRGVVPLKFSLTKNDAPTCALPAATISVTRTAGGTTDSVDERMYSTPADNGSNFRIDSAACQYIYNIAARSLGVGTYRVDISITGSVVGSAVFVLQ